jgi:hypothetical protein
MEIVDDDLNTEKLIIEVSLTLPTVKVCTIDAITKFFEDDSGYF